MENIQSNKNMIIKECFFFSFSLWLLLFFALQMKWLQLDYDENVVIQRKKKRNDFQPIIYDLYNLYNS